MLGVSNIFSFVPSKEGGSLTINILPDIFGFIQESLDFFS